MKILVTGGLGFIGHNVVSKLEQRKHEVIIIDNKTTYGIIPQTEIDFLVKKRMEKINSQYIYNYDITDNIIDEVFKKHEPDILIHLASFPRQKVVNNNPQLGSRYMSEGLLNVLEYSKKYKIQRFVYISSSMVYGDFTDGVIEDVYCRPQGQYGILKLAGEWLVRDYTTTHDLSHTIIRPSAVYGPLDVEDRVVSKFLLNAMRDKLIKVNGSDEMLDFTYVDDVANGIAVAALTQKSLNKTYNITRGHSRSLLDAASMIIDIVGKGKLSIDSRDINFPKRGALNIDAARKDFDYDPKIDIEEGFKKYHDWLKSPDIYDTSLWFSKTIR